MASKVNVQTPPHCAARGLVGRTLPLGLGSAFCPRRSSPYSVLPFLGGTMVQVSHVLCPC